MILGSDLNVVSFEPWSKTRFSLIHGLDIDGEGTIYVPDMDGGYIRKVFPNGSDILWAGSGNVGYCDGVGRDAVFNKPVDLSIAPDRFINECCGRQKLQDQAHLFKCECDNAWGLAIWLCRRYRSRSEAGISGRGSSYQTRNELYRRCLQPCDSTANIGR
jgi:hypothetical protein